MLSKAQRRLMSMCILTAKNMSPVDTGLLRHRATYGEALSDGFKIKFDGQKAYYIGFLQFGTVHSKKHKGYIDRIKGTLRDMAIDYYTGGRDRVYSQATALSRSFLSNREEMTNAHWKTIDKMEKHNYKRFNEFGDAQYKSYVERKRSM